MLPRPTIIYGQRCAVLTSVLRLFHRYFLQPLFTLAGVRARFSVGGQIITHATCVDKSILLT
jgi:hypothetical protein